MQIRNNDIPERMQLRDIPVTPVPDDSNELEEEANWIYRQAFCKPTISTQVSVTLPSINDLFMSIKMRKKYTIFSFAGL